MLCLSLSRSLVCDILLVIFELLEDNKIFKVKQISRCHLVSLYFKFIILFSLNSILLMKVINGNGSLNLML